MYVHDYWRGQSPPNLLAKDSLTSVSSANLKVTKNLLKLNPTYEERTNRTNDKIKGYEEDGFSKI
jgi:hypothetical protein